MEHVFDRAEGLVTFKGTLTEMDSLESLAAELKAPVIFDLSQVTRINSSGVRQWIRFVNALPGSLDVKLRNCSPCFVAQLNMISNFAGPAKVSSIVVPFLCTGCGADIERVFSVEALSAGEPPAPPCDRCGKPTEIDVLTDEYFAFIKK